MTSKTLMKTLMPLVVPTIGRAVEGAAQQNRWKHGREVTVYVKGFMSAGESEMDFSDWVSSHARLGTAHHWQPNAFGYHWGTHGRGWLAAATKDHIGMLPVPAVSAGVAAVALTGARVLQTARLGSAPAIAGAVAADLLANAGRLAIQFKQASDNATAEAGLLAEALLGLRQEYDYVRLVAHSLGCKKTMAAAAALHASERPNEIHLCAAAMPVCRGCCVCVGWFGGGGGGGGGSRRSVGHAGAHP
jgi:hypothetical protein